MTDKEKIIAELERRLEKYGQDYQIVTLLDFIKNLPKQEPQALDEAAEEHMNNIAFSDEFEKIQCISDFKAGAEWMARQGETFNGFMSARGKRRSLIAIEGSSQNFKFGENVIVQIRKKEE